MSEFIDVLKETLVDIAPAWLWVLIIVVGILAFLSVVVFDHLGSVLVVTFILGFCYYFKDEIKEWPKEWMEYYEAWKSTHQ